MFGDCADQIGKADTRSGSEGARRSRNDRHAPTQQTPFEAERGRAARVTVSLSSIRSCPRGFGDSPFMHPALRMQPDKTGLTYASLQCATEQWIVKSAKRTWFSLPDAARGTPTACTTRAPPCLARLASARSRSGSRCDDDVQSNHESTVVRSTRATTRSSADRVGSEIEPSIF